jgi:predicted RNase H-like HicB family nuclease
MQLYYAIVHQEEESAFGISFPDLPGCFSAADDENEVVKQAQEALSLYAAGLDVLPMARSLQQLRLDAEVQADLADGAFLISVPLIAMDHKARYNLMLDSALVAGIDTIAKTVGISRSEFVSDTMQKRLEEEVGAVIVKSAVGRSGSIAFRRAVPAAAKSEKKAATSTLTQSHSAKESTGTKVAAAASKVLRDPKAGKDAKTAAASALTQKVKAKAKKK